MEKKQWTLAVAGRDMIVTTGQLAHQANGSVTVQYGETVVMATATMSKGMGFAKGYFPLMVEYEERYYAAGKIKGSRFIKREGRPSDEAVLTGRLIDRTIRPLFPARMRNDVQVVVTVLSIDGENDPDMLAVVAASTALTISNIPWNGPVAAVRVGQKEGKLVVNPTVSDQAESKLDVVIAGTETKVNMIETAASEMTEEVVLEALTMGQKAVAEIAQFVTKIRTEAGEEKAKPILMKASDELETTIREKLVQAGLADALYGIDKSEISAKMKVISDEVKAHIVENVSDEDKEVFDDVFAEVLDETADALIHQGVLKSDKRPDGRAMDEIRALDAQVGILPRTHGTGLFQRGETQVLTVATLGSPGDEMVVDTMEVDTKKRYIHFYNFPPYCVGEVRPMRGPGRREIGHGMLAEKALLPVLPARKDFPYTMILMSEVLGSNGSSSMASTCGSTLALMDAGVPIKRPVSGIAMGVIIDDDGQYKILTDIQGAEDHYGDMDFKVAGTTEGITALQMDVKVDGVDIAILTDALEAARIARMQILDVMTATIATARTEMSPYAPRIVQMKINPDKIRDVIGPGGKMINEIIDETGVAIDIEDDGSVFITSTDGESAKKAVEWIGNITREIAAGEKYMGRVVKLMNFGAFVELLPGQDGLVHISEFEKQGIRRMDDVIEVGSMIEVIVKEIDNQGRVNLGLVTAPELK